MKPYKYVEFEGKLYPLFRINIVDQSTEESARQLKFESVIISVESLSQQIIDRASGMPVNSLATEIDECIFFYIPDEMIHKTKADVADYVSDNCW